MEDVIREQVQDEDVDSVEEISLDEWRGTGISEGDKSALETYSSLNVLSMSGCGLTSLANFPHLTTLIKLDLSDNSLTGGLEHLKHCKGLLQLNLADNNLKSIADLRPLALLANLYSLELSGNPVADIEGFRGKIFELCSSLEILDGLNANGEEDSFSDEGSSVVSDEDFSPESDEDEDEEDVPSDSEEYRPKRKGKTQEPESQPHKQRK